MYCKSAKHYSYVDYDVCPSIFKIGTRPVHKSNDSVVTNFLTTQE